MAHGATHYTHWFVPMTGSTAEKHDSFLTPTGEARRSPSSAARTCSRVSRTRRRSRRAASAPRSRRAATPRWDVTSPIFLQVEPNGVTLTIPTAYVSFTGEALDYKIPLLRSQDALGKQALRVLRWFGNTAATRVFTNIGPEQEYFLVDRRLAEQRPDLLLTGRTLFGAPSPKGQELEDQYFGPIRERILAFMMDLDRELWRLGIPAKTRHNEVAPAQFEMAPVYEPTSVGSDHNMIVMSPMRRLAHQHGLMLLIHEKPFAGINGSGKHNNWSMATDEGENLLDPGKTPHANAQFLAFLLAVIRGVNVHADLLRACDRRRRQRPPPGRQRGAAGDHVGLPGLAARGRDPPAGARARRPSRRMAARSTWGSTSLPALPRDATDRNRTSPFAFTGNKFEFRAVGSSAPIYWPQTVLNVAVADSLSSSRTSSRSSSPTTSTGWARSCPRSPGTTSRSCSRATATRRSGTPRPSDAACPTTRRRSRRCRRSPRQEAKSSSPSSASCPSASSGHASKSPGSATSRSATSRPAAPLDIARTMILPAAVRYLGQLYAAAASRGRQALCERSSGAGRSAGRRNRGARARPARGPRGGLGPGRGARVRREGDPGADRAARGCRRAGDARCRRPVAAAQVPGAALPVLRSHGPAQKRPAEVPQRPGVSVSATQPRFDTCPWDGR